MNKDSGDAHIPASTIGSPAVSRLCQLLRESTKLRTLNIPVPPSKITPLVRGAVLFSGGLDCTVLARLIHDNLPEEQEIDLLNVAFENPRVIQAASSVSCPSLVAASSPFSLCPDRITGLASHQELLQTCPGRIWRFVAIDVTYTELQARRMEIISLIRPHNTEMDFSIACAFYFAAHGRGTICHPDHISMIPYTTPARVLFSGLGADELFGGYTRHATAFRRRGYQGLVEEMEIDFNRLGSRNLGRDDRVISYWGKEVRYPYLDDDLVTWALSIPIWEKCGFGQGNGHQVSEPVLEPGKKLLRLLAYHLGLPSVAIETKRAIQFGARSARMEAGKMKGTHLLA